MSRAASGSEQPDFESGTVALDDLLDARRCARVDLVKMDIEGGEVEAIKGMTAGLAQHRYRFMVLECHPALIVQSGSTLDRCLAPLVQAGYRGWRIDHSPEMHRRAALAPVAFADMLSPIDVDALQSDPWPHLLWLAPGESLPA